MEADLTARRFYENVVQSSRPHGINDNRLRAIELSLGSWMLIFTGIIDTLFGEPERLSLFNRDFSKSNGQTFYSALRPLQARRHSVLKPDVIVLDEASKPTEPESWNVLANYELRTFIFISDYQQLRPIVQSGPGINNFAGQLSLSLFDHPGFTDANSESTFEGFPPFLVPNRTDDRVVRPRRKTMVGCASRPHSAVSFVSASGVIAVSDLRTHLMVGTYVTMSPSQHAVPGVSEGIMTASSCRGI